MITGDLKTKINKLWEDFWTGGITNHPVKRFKEVYHNNKNVVDIIKKNSLNLQDTVKRIIEKFK